MTISVGGNGRMAGMFQPPKAPITLTEAAASRVRELVTRSGDAGVVGLRVGVNHTGRSEERLVGQACLSMCRYRWLSYHSKKNNSHDLHITVNAQSQTNEASEQ